MLFLTFHTHNLINRDIRALQANMSYKVEFERDEFIVSNM